jgi:cytoskeleton protein RodZ
MMEHQNNAEQDNRYSATLPASLGTMLREARERLGLSVADVAAQIKFAPRQIEALEEDDFKQLPETAFLRGFVRSYAKILHLDVQPLLEALPQVEVATAELVPPSVGVPYPSEHISRRQTLVLLGAALLLAVIAVGFSVWHLSPPLKYPAEANLETPVLLPVEKQAIPESSPARQNNMTPPSSPAEAMKRSSIAEEQPSVRAAKTGTVTTVGLSSAVVGQSSVRAAKTEAVATVVKSSVRAVKAEAVESKPKTVAGTIDDSATQATTLRLVFDEEAWTEIKDKDGNTISSQINPRGSELNVEGHLPMSLVIGHAATTHLYQDGELVDLSPYTNSSSEVARITLE